LGEYVEPVQLQVVCLQLWQSLQATQGDRIRLEDLKSLGGGAGLEGGGRRAGALGSRAGGGRDGGGGGGGG
jgi:hypothetical protein